METKPMIHMLSARGRADSGLDARVAGKRYAFLAIVGNRYAARLGVAVANEPGYHLIPEEFAHSDCMLEMQKYADQLNAAMRLTVRDAGKLVASTFAAGRGDLPPRDTGALRRLSARRDALARSNNTLARILEKPPPRGAVIRFTDGKPRPRPTAPRGLPTWENANNTGVLMSIRKTSGEIVLRLENASNGTPRFRTFNTASPLVFSVERVPVPGELIDIDLLPTRLRSVERRRRADPDPSRPPLSRH